MYIYIYIDSTYEPNVFQAVNLSQPIQRGLTEVLTSADPEAKKKKLSAELATGQTLGF